MTRGKKVGINHKLVFLNKDHSLFIPKEIADEFETEYNGLITLGKLMGSINYQYLNFFKEECQFKFTNKDGKFYVVIKINKNRTIKEMMFSTSYKSLWKRCNDIIEKNESLLFDFKYQAATYTFESESPENFTSVLKLAKMVM